MGKGELSILLDPSNRVSSLATAQNQRRDPKARISSGLYHHLPIHHTHCLHSTTGRLHRQPHQPSPQHVELHDCPDSPARYHS